MAVKGRQTPEQRRHAREERKLRNAPAPPKVDSQFVEITGGAKVDVEDPELGSIRTDHQGAVGELEGTYYNAERQEHMGRVRVGQKADGSAGQLRGIPLSRLKGINAPAPTVPRSSTIQSGPLGISNDRWEEIFGKPSPGLNLMSDEEREQLQAELEAAKQKVQN